MRIPIACRSSAWRPARTPICSRRRSRGTVRASSRWRPARRSRSPARRSDGPRADDRAARGREGLVAVASHPDADLVLCASCRHRRARGGARRHRCRQDDRARQQGNPGDGRRHRHRSGARAKAWRSCRSTASTTPSTSACTAATSPKSAGSSSPRPADRSAAGRRLNCQTCLGGRRAEASDVADGTEDHDRFGDADEQGARGDRGALAVRRPAPIRSTSSFIRSRSCTRWSSSSTARSSRSSASPTCGCRFSTRSRIPSAGRHRCRRSISRAPDASTSTRPTPRRFRALRLAYRALEAERSLPVVLNAANEVAVARFLEGRLGFTLDSGDHRADDGCASTGRGAHARGGARGGRVGARVMLRTWPAG